MKKRRMPRIRGIDDELYLCAGLITNQNPGPLDALIAQCHAAQWLKPYPPEHASVTMTATLTAVQSATHLIRRLYGVGPMTAEQAEQHAEQVIDVLLNGMLARPASRRRTAGAS